MKYLVATIKDWNIKEYEKYSKEFEGDWYLITNKKELTLDRIKGINPEYIFFPHWSWVVPKEITDNYKCICFHMSDLPYGRGGSPLQNLIIRGHKKTKVTALKMTQKIDFGDIYKKVDLDLSGSAQEIFIRASEHITKLINYIIVENPEPKVQKGKGVLFDRRKPMQSEIPKDANIDEMYNHIRMMDADTYPKAYINYGDYHFVFSKANVKDGKLSAFVEIEKVDE